MPIDLLLDGWLGLAFAWCARERVRADGPWSRTSITLVAIFLCTIRIPSVVYFHLAHPSWSWLYLVDPTHVPRLAVVSIAAASVAATAGGYYAGARLVRAGRDRLALGLLAGGLGLLLVVVTLARHRVLSYGSHAQYHAGHALPLWDVKLGYVLVAVALGVLASAAFVGWALHRDGRCASVR